jgi:DNA-binding MarR family transcriptional regulator
LDANRYAVSRSTTIEDERGCAADIRKLAMVLVKLHARFYEQRLAQIAPEISGLQMGVLRVLTVGEKTVSELSRWMVLDPSTLVPVVDKLERAGLLERGRDPQDRRRIPLAITAEGRAMVERLPFLNDDDPLLMAVRQIGHEHAAQLALLLRALIAEMPDGAVLLEEITQHLQGQHRDTSAS